MARAGWTRPELLVEHGLDSRSRRHPRCSWSRMLGPGASGSAASRASPSSGARSPAIQVAASRSGHRLRAEVADDGCGFVAEPRVASAATGLRGMRERPMLDGVDVMVVDLGLPDVAPRCGVVQVR